MELPKTKSTISNDPMSYSILLFGPIKSGKSTFASKADNAIFLCTEPGLNALSVFKVDIGNWSEMLDACKELSKQEHEFKTVIIDTIDNSYEHCLEYICKKMKIEHPADLDYGKGWSAVNLEFKRVLTKLAAMPQGLIVISHSKVQEIKTKTGKYDRIVPSTGGSKVVLGLMDMVLMVEVEAVKNDDGTILHRRIIHTRPTANYDAGSRIKNFPDPIDLSYEAFIKAFATATAATATSKKDKK